MLKTTMKKMTLSPSGFVCLLVTLLLSLLIGRPCFSQQAGLRKNLAPPPSLPHTAFNDPVFTQIYLSHLQPLKPYDKIIYATWFSSDDAKIAQVCVVDESGKATAGTSVYHWAFQGGTSSQLDAKRLKALHFALHSLPPSSVHVPLPSLLLLSYQDGDAWVTREYDRQHLPKQVQQVCSLVVVLL